ncbi:MAG TPA: DEAD/DEAH box helicase [Terriglobia bacterium]|nr:DEAD/DEAH box helicase [Terriglobia bacterium]
MRHPPDSQRPVRDPLALFHPAVQDWFRASFPAPTAPQRMGWPAIMGGESTLIVAPTGNGKTLAAFLWCLERLMFEPVPEKARRCRILYVSPLKALAIDVERNLRLPLAGIARAARKRSENCTMPAVAIRTGDTPADERARFRRHPADILITTPESLYLLLTSNAREALRSVDTFILDEIHALVPGKRGAHLAISIERLDHLCRSRLKRPLQRIGLSATQRPLDEVARFLGGAEEKTKLTTEVAETTEDSLATSWVPSVPSVSSVSSVVQPFSSEAADNRFSSGSALQHDQFEAGPIVYRPVTIIDTGERKRLHLTVEVPVEDMARIGRSHAGADRDGDGGQAGTRDSIWSAIYPRLVELIRVHRSTLLFVNNRRLAERTAGALNDVAGEPLARAHHGSLAREERVAVEEQLKAGTLRALVATSSLELGIDMGAIDLVVEIEAPPSVASGLQRIGRGGHQAGAVSEGIIFPKYRGDLVACAASTRAMLDGRIESVRYPRLPLDVLAQQIVSTVAMDDWPLDGLLALVRRAAPFTRLSRAVFEGVLDMLSGRYPSDEFGELRPRLNWDRTTGTLSARTGARHLAVTSGGTIPDRGLYGVFRTGAAQGSARVGELDEEMVFETPVGETFVLGASTWRVDEITHDRVLVSPAPGEPGKMPFWHGDRQGRPLEFGHEIGALVRTLRAMPPGAAVSRLTREHCLNESAAENLVNYLAEQAAATAGAVPDDQTLIIERCRDEMGDWRVCLLSPFGSRVHAPWCMAATARVRDAGHWEEIDLESLWTDDGFVLRFPDVDQPPDASLLVPTPAEIESLVVNQLGRSAVFAARFREAAARALLLPRRRPGTRFPLWQQRKKAADLLAVASRFPSFPLLLETYRECLHDEFDMRGLTATLERIREGSLRVLTVDSESPSPFASSLMFGYVANFIYDGDAPLAERRAQALTIDQSRLRELLGDLDLREILDPAAVEQVERELQRLEENRRARSADGVHDLLLGLGDLSRAEIDARSAAPEVAKSIAALARSRRAVAVSVARVARYIAAEDAGRYRDALGVRLPRGLPGAFLEASLQPLEDLVSRYARTHGPFTAGEAARRFGAPGVAVEAALKSLAARGRLFEGAFRPAGPVREAREWCDAEVLRRIRHRSLAAARRQIEPVEPRTFARLLTHWQGVLKPRAGLDALLDAVESLEGAPLLASVLESEILPARVRNYRPDDLDTLLAAGEVVWCGIEPVGDRDGRAALYLADHLALLQDGSRVSRVGSRSAESRLRSPDSRHPTPDSRSSLIRQFLLQNGASFFPVIHQAVGDGYPGQTVDDLWDLVWSGIISNDSFGALRAFVDRSRPRRPPPALPFRSRKSRQAGATVPARAQGRWSLIESRLTSVPSPTDRANALARTLLRRYGVVVREAPEAESVAGGFSAVYPVLKAMEESGQVRRGMFVAGLGATQFAEPAALELLRSLSGEPEAAEAVELAATDPANPWGALLKWPESAAALTRTAGASVILVNGSLAVYRRAGSAEIQVFLPEGEPDRSRTAAGVAACLLGRAQHEHALFTRDRERGLERDRRRGLLIARINGGNASAHPLAPSLEANGFLPGARGYHLPRRAVETGIQETLELPETG